MRAVGWLVLSWVLLEGWCPAFAQDGIHPYVEYRKRVEATQNISPLDHGLFGDQVSLYNGATEFAVTDIDIPGNNALPVRLGRRLSVELQPQGHTMSYDARLLGIGNWDVEVPYMAAVYPASSGWSATRCSVGSVPVLGGLFHRLEYWNGITVHVPGRGSTNVLGMQAATPRPSAGMYKLATSERDVFDCIPMKAGLAGDGFRMTTSEGVRYYFDVATSRTAARLKKYVKVGGGPLPEPIYLDRNKTYLLASKIEDRFGNTVQFQYNVNGHPTRIWSSDGREIVLSYASGRLTSATAHGRTWQYQYNAAGNLVQVTNPDSSRWSYSYTGNLRPPPPSAVLPPLPWCGGSPVMLNQAYELVATHPSGATGTFVFSNRRHYRSGVHATECMQEGDPYDPDYTLLVPHYFDVMSVDSKTITGPGVSPMAWGYDYVPAIQFLWGSPAAPAVYPCTTCTPEKTLTVTHPDGSKARHTYGMRYRDNDGRLLKVETLRPDDTVIRTELSTYMTEAQAGSQPFHGEYGSNLGGVSDPASTRIRPVTNRTVSQDGVDFIWHANTFDAMARPRQVTRSSTLPAGPARTEETTYHDNTAIWVLGQVAQVRCVAPTTALPAGCGSAGTVMSATTYHASLALPLATSRFGKTLQTLGYDTTSSVASGQRGTVRTVADGNGNTTTLTGWKRGIPQTIKYPGTPEAPTGATQSAIVNDSGWITRVTDENGYQTNYTHDAMGRLASIAWPTGDSTAWNTTTQAFQQIASSEYGIPAGHWRQTVATGNGRRITYFDGLWRPLVTREYDTGNQSGTQRFQRFTYDHAGRTTFASYPSTASGASTGTWTEYDALGRPTSVSQDSELSPAILVSTTQYLNGFQTRSTNPKGHQTTTTYLAWDQPTTEHPLRITHPAGAYTHITRDVFGKPTRLRRSNSSSPTGGTVALDRNYAYNAHQELCRAVEPETRATLMGYDGAGNLTWSASGLAAGTACHATGNHSTINPRKATRSYDARNRLTALAFANGIGNQAWTYTPDGLPATISTHNTSGGSLVTNAYEYNRRRLLVGESVKRGSAAAWALGYGYNANGHLASQVYPSGLAVSYAPNALGQPTQAGSYATGVSWYPNGALKAFTYGNGMVHTATQNARGLPLRTTDCAATGTCSAANRRLDLQYAYDANGNVSQITDHVTGGKQTRGMSYDPLDRLVQTTSTMFGTASYGYDVLDNLNTVHVSGGSQARNHTYAYDPATRRLSQVTNTVGGAVVANLAYDVQGNLVSKGGQAYQFDLGNRLRSVPGQETGYEYDGHGRRVFAQTVGSGQVLSQYGNDGRLIYQEDQRHGRRTDYVYLGNRLVAYRERPLSSSTATVKYQHVDALGTPVAVTNAAKATIETGEYEPYGRLVNRPLFDGPGYTGHVQDAATGLTYMQQRYYDPLLGVFLSVDPVRANTRSGRNFNRYSYANNNPYRFTDPDGRLSREKVEPPLPPPPPTELATVTVTEQSQPVTLRAVTVTAPRPISMPGPTPIPWGRMGSSIANFGKGLSGPLLFLYSPHPCGGERCGDLAVFSESQPKESDLTKVKERDANKVAQDAGYDDAHDAKKGRGEGGVDIYHDKSTGRNWLWNGVPGAEKESLK